MTTQTEAQRLAAKMKSYKLASGYAWHCHKAGDELLRLEAANAELLEVLNDLFGADMEYCMMGDGKDDQIAAIAKARAAIAKHGGAA